MILTDGFHCVFVVSAAHLCIFGALFVSIGSILYYNDTIWPSSGQVELRASIVVGLTPACITQLAVPSIEDVLVTLNVTTSGAPCDDQIRVNDYLAMCQCLGHPETAQINCYDDGVIDRVYSVITLGFYMLLLGTCVFLVYLFILCITKCNVRSKTDVIRNDGYARLDVGIV
jgi:hypothetical protein